MKKRKISKFQERLTAYHEAGHAVAHFLFDEKIKFVTIIPNFEKGHQGRVEIFEARADFERLVIVSLSGYVGEINYPYRRDKLAALLDLHKTAKTEI